jgi:hypothetical protein
VGGLYYIYWEAYITFSGMHVSHLLSGLCHTYYQAYILLTRRPVLHLKGSLHYVSWEACIIFTGRPVLHLQGGLYYINQVDGGGVGFISLTWGHVFAESLGHYYPVLYLVIFQNGTYRPSGGTHSGI